MSLLRRPTNPLNATIYAFGGFVLPEQGGPAWNAIDNAWEYNPGTDEWKALAPLPTALDEFVPS